MPVCGGFSDEREIDDDVIGLLETVRGPRPSPSDRRPFVTRGAPPPPQCAAAIKESLGGEFEPKSFTSQVVAGTNFLVRGAVDGKPASVKIFRPLPHTGAPPRVSEAAFD